MNKLPKREKSLTYIIQENKLDEKRQKKSR